MLASADEMAAAQIAADTKKTPTVLKVGNTQLHVLN